jgi:hypothetical protein
MHGRDENCITTFIMRRKGMRAVGKLRHKLESNIEMDLKYDVKAWTGFSWLTWQLPVNTEMKLRTLGKTNFSNC